MRIMVNGEAVEAETGISLHDWLQRQNREQQPLVIEHNGNVLARHGWTDVILQEDDRLEILVFLGGG